PAPCLQPARLEVALVVDDEDRIRLELVELRRRLHRAARVVHERLGLQQRDLVAVDPDVGELPRELALPGAVVAAGELVDDHLPDVVTVTDVLPPGIAEADDEQVERRGALAPPPGQAHLLLAGFGRAALFAGCGLRTLGSGFGRLALDALFAFDGLDLGLLDAGRHRHGRKHRRLEIVEHGDRVRHLELRQTERVADVHAGDVDVEVLGNLERQAFDVYLVDDLREYPALLDADGLADECNRDRRMDHLVEADL